MKRYRAPGVVLLLLLLAAYPGYGEPERFTITGELQQVDVKSHAQQLRIIPVDTAAERSAGSVAGLLEQTANVTVSSSGGPLQPAVISLRGSSAEQVLVLIDGRRVNSAQGGGVDLSAIPLIQVDHIEVISGAMSALYGENAVGGVVNIVMKEAAGDSPYWSSSYSYGSWNTHTGSVYLQGKVPLGPELSSGRFEQGFDYTMGLSMLFTDADYRYERLLSAAELIRTNAGGKRGSGMLSLGWDLSRTRGLRGEVDLRVSADEKGVPGTIEFPLEHARMADERTSLTAGFFYEHNPIATAALELGAAHALRTYDPDSSSGPVSEESEHRNSSWSVELSGERTDDLRVVRSRLTGGLSYRYDHLNSSELLQADDGGRAQSGELHRSLYGVYVQSSIELMPRVDGYVPLTINPVFRYDLSDLRYRQAGYERQDQHSSWSIGAIVPLTGDRSVVLKGNVGTAYRVPSFDDLFWPSSAFAAGNPYLSPERALSGDLTLHLDPHRMLSIEVTCFGERVDDLIQWNPSGTGQWTPQNIGNALIQGCDISAAGVSDDLLPGRCSYALSYSFLRAVDATFASPVFGRQLPRRPLHAADLNLSYTPDEALSVSLHASYVGYRWYTAQNTKYLPAYLTIDAAAEWNVSPSLSLLVRIDNLTDVSYVDIADNPIPGRACTLTFTYIPVPQKENRS
jgi:vitamin B12 transporter